MRLLWALLLGTLITLGCDPDPQDDDTTQADDDTTATDDDDTTPTADDDDNTTPAGDDDDDTTPTGDDDDSASSPTCTLTAPADTPTIQSGLDHLIAGDTLCVEPGTYVESLLIPPHAIHLLGLAGPALTIIDGSAADVVVSVTGGNGPDTLVEGFTLTNGSSIWGGGLFVEASSPTLRHLWIQDNTATHGGGAVVAGGAPAFENVVVARNTSIADGGGLFIYEDANATLSRVLFSHNRAESEVYGGGGLYLRYGAAVLEHVVFRENTSGASGGGLMVREAEISVSHGVFDGNVADVEHGGGIYLWDATATMDHLIVTGNSAPLGAGDGVRCRDCEATFVYTDLWGNGDEDVSGMTHPAGVAGNLSVDPQLLDPGAGDVHLAATSPLVDAGDPAALDPDGSPSDVGAYAGPGASTWDLDGDGYPQWWQPGPYDPHMYPGQGWDCDDLDATITPGSGC